MNLKERLQKELDIPESHFASHQSDLHVKWSVDAHYWLVNNYEFYKNVTTFFSNLDGKLWFDIPFANEEN